MLGCADASAPPYPVALDLAWCPTQHGKCRILTVRGMGFMAASERGRHPATAPGLIGPGAIKYTELIIV
jgi:hypothetical protein